MEWLHNIPSSSKNMFLIFDFKVILFCFCLLYMFKHHIFRWTVLNSKHNTQMFNVFNIFHGIIIRLFSCWRYVVHYFTVFLNVNKERTIWWCHMTSSNWQFWPWNTRHQKSKPKKKKRCSLVARLTYLLFVSSAVSGQAMLRVIHTGYSWGYRWNGSQHISQYLAGLSSLPQSWLDLLEMCWTC